MCTVGKSIQAESGSVVARDGGGGRMKTSYEWIQDYFWDDENIIELDSGPIL